jgi:ArsR family transcriptional regulator
VQRLLRLLADPTRLRILLALEGEELAVNELSEVLGLAQSRTSNHLRLLKDGAALSDRREGSWTFYRNRIAESDATRELWRAVSGAMRGDAEVRRDLARKREAIERRRRRSRAHFAQERAAGAGFVLETLREEICAVLAPRTLRVVDAGCGDGHLTEALAERFDRVVAVDHSPERLRRARERIVGRGVAFAAGELDALPLPDASADAVVLSLVLHHVPEIGPALREAARVLSPGGAVAIADLAPHSEEWMREAMGDLRLGLEPATLRRTLEEAGFQEIRVTPARDRLVARGGKSLELLLASGRKPPAACRTRKGKESR